VFAEYYHHEMAAGSERKLWNALKFGQSGEVNSKEGLAIVEGLELTPPNCSEAVTPQIELNGAVGEALILQPPPQRLRTKQFFDVRINNPFLD